MRLGGNSGGEKDRIDRDARAVRRLAQADAPAEKCVLGEDGTGIGGRRRAQRSASSAAAITARALT